MFTALSSYPVEFWNKTPYFFPSILAIYLFENIALCPTEHNDYRSVYSPYYFTSQQLSTLPSQRVVSFALILFSYGSTWIVNNLLGNRTGELLSYLLRTIFFVAILFQTLITLLTVRLVLMDQAQEIQ